MSFKVGDNQYSLNCLTKLGALTLDGRSITIEIGMCLDNHYYCYLRASDKQIFYTISARNRAGVPAVVASARPGGVVDNLYTE